jgi:hypothetical protein
MRANICVCSGIRTHDLIVGAVKGHIVDGEATAIGSPVVFSLRKFLASSVGMKGDSM